MALIKIGSNLKILKTAAVMEDLIVDRPLAEKPTGANVIEPKHSDFLYYRARAISAGDQGPLSRDGSRGFNYNGNYDYFPRKELEASYETFTGRNIFLDHNSASSLYSVGKVIDAYPVDDKESGEFYIEILGKIDRTLHPEICRKIETGELNATSMGCSVDESKCSICGHVLHSDADDKCDHMGPMGLGKKFQAEIDLPEYGIRKGEMVPCFSINSGIVFNEDSIVGVPADSSAVIKTVFSNMRNQLRRKASLTKKEQIDLVAQMETLFSKLDDSTQKDVRAEFCSICPPPVEKESDMSEKSLPNEDTKKILQKLSALEMEQLESYVQHKTRKANEIVNKEVVAEATKKEESFLKKVIAGVKNSFAAQLLEKKVEAVAKEELKKEAEFVKCPNCDSVAARKEGDKVTCVTCDYDSTKKSSLTAKFNENETDVLASTWSIYDGGKLVLDASLKDIWGAKFALLSFAQQEFATSENYGKAIIARYEQDGLEKLADLWDVSHKLSKTAKGPELGPDGSFAKPSTGSSNKEHDVKNTPVSKPGQETAQKGPAAPAADEVKTETKLDMPGQEKGQTGPAAEKPMKVETDYSEPKPEAEGKEVKTTPKNPDEKDADKSAKEVKTDYVAAGTEAIEAEDKDSKKKESSLISWSSLTPKAQEFVKTASKKYIESGMKNVEAVAKAYNEFTAQETIMEKKAAEKPVEAVEESTIPTGKKEMGDKPEESVQGTTLPEEGKSATPETSAQGDKAPKTPNLTKAPDEAVDGKPAQSANPSSKPDEAVTDKKEHTTPNLTKAPDEAVSKSAATEMPTPEAPEMAAPKPEHEMEEMPLDPMAPKMDAPEVAEVSAFDKADVLEIGEGYTAHKDKATNEIVIKKDEKEVKRLPDGFGKEVGEVLKLMKAVLGLPVEEVQNEVKVEEKPAEMPKMEEHPALEEAHEDELAMKESALKAKEADLAKKEAALKAKEDAAAKEEQTKKFASLVQARSERCKKVVVAMIDKGALQMNSEVYDSEVHQGTYLLDARKKAFEAAITSKQKELMAMSDEGLLAVENAIKDLPAPSPINQKKANRFYVSPEYTIPSEDDEIKKIFNTMGTKNRPQ